MLREAGAAALHPDANQGLSGGLRWSCRNWLVGRDGFLVSHAVSVLVEVPDDPIEHFDRILVGDGAPVVAQTLQHALGTVIVRFQCLRELMAPNLSLRIAFAVDGVARVLQMADG